MAQQEVDINESQEERLYAEAEDVAQRAFSHMPTEETWGIESYGDAPGGIGGGVGGFLWFDTLAELLDFTGRLLPFFNPGSGPLEPFEVARHASTIIEQVQKGMLSMDEGMAQLNTALKNYSQIRWWGQFKELLHGDRVFEKELRSIFRYGASKSSSDSSPVPIDQVDSFINFIEKEWGL
jgi:hypothetical protein